MDVPRPPSQYLQVFMDLTRIGRMTGEQVFQVSCAVNRTCQPTGHDAQGYTDAGQEEYRRECRLDQVGNVHGHYHASNRMGEETPDA